PLLQCLWPHRKDGGGRRRRRPCRLGSPGHDQARSRASAGGSRQEIRHEAEPARARREARRTRGLRRHHLRHAHALRQYVRADAQLLDQTGSLWMQGALVGKVGSVFASTATQHGGQETTITSFHSTLLHQGMIIVGLPYAFPGLTNMNEITGGSPYGAGTLANADGSRQPSANELDGARYQGKHVAQITAKLTHNP